jgi:type III secretory pathway component EscV
MVQVISNLGSGSFDAVTVVRPIMVSLAFAIVIPITCRFIVAPVTVRLNSYREANPASEMSKLLASRQTALVIHTAFLLGIVVGAAFAGTSSLLAAYIAGAAISWWDSEVPHLQHQDPSSLTSGDSDQAAATDNQTMDESSSAQASPKVMEGGSGAEIFHDYYEPTLQRLLKPFFFVG